MFNIDHLNAEQKLAVTHGEGPLLIVAGAGTGKTAVITQRIAYLLQEKNVSHSAILALTFTEKAAQEMEERVDRIMPYGYAEIQISTFHGFCNSILDEFGLDMGLSYQSKLLDDTQRWILVKKNLKKFALEYYQPKGNPTKFIKELLKHFSKCKNELIFPSDYMKYAQAYAKKKSADKQESQRLLEIAQAYECYNQLLLDSSAMDFDDQLLHVYDLLKTRKNILKILQKRFEYILVDEFQDTNFVQYEIVRMLSGKKQNLTVVGDDDQSIYKFRGASITNIDHFLKDFSQAKKVFLTQNYRSGQVILDRSYELIQHNNPHRLEARLQEENIQESFTCSKKLTANIPESGFVRHEHFVDMASENYFISNTILNMKIADKNLRWNDFAILLRSLSHVDPLLAQLRDNGIPFRINNRSGLLNQRVVLDVLSYLRLLDNYHESSAMYQILRSPIIDISDHDLMQIMHWAKRKGWSLYASTMQAKNNLDISSETQLEIDQLELFIKKHTQASGNTPVSRIIYEFMMNLGYYDSLRKKDDQDAYKSIQYVNTFYKMCLDFEQQTQEKTLRAFLDYIEMLLDAGDLGTLPKDTDAGPEEVQIMTVHGSKGLEFTHVFLPSLIEQRFPSMQKADPLPIPDALLREEVPHDEYHIEEERRLFYVAMTRARLGLYLLSSESYSEKETNRVRKISRFIIESGVRKEGEKPSPQFGSPNYLEEERVFFDEGGLQYVFPLPKAYSFSSLNTYGNCPLQFQFANVFMIPTTGSAATSFGTTIHSALNRYFHEVKNRFGEQQESLFDQKESEYPDRDFLLDIYESSWVDEWYADEDEKKRYFDNGRRILTTYYESIQAAKPIPYLLEKKFTLKVGETVIKGSIDRIDLDTDGSAIIIDYKTGNPKTSLQTEDKQQLLLYKYAVEKQLGLKVSKLMYIYLEDASSLEVKGSEKEVTTMLETLQKRLDLIHKREFPAKPSPLCKYCAFRSICEFKEI